MGWGVVFRRQHSCFAGWFSHRHQRNAGRLVCVLKDFLGATAIDQWKEPARNSCHVSYSLNYLEGVM